MEHRTHDEVARVAGLYSSSGLAEPMSREQRLNRWISLLEAEPRRRLETLRETEFHPIAARDALRGDDTAITVAFEDPVLRADGLAGDSYGDAKRFFGLSDLQLHHVVCGCHNGWAMSADTAARRLSAFLPNAMRPGLLRRVVRALTGWHPH